MAIKIRYDLDGLRLYSATSDKVWLMIHGRRRLVSTSSVYENLFSEAENLHPAADIDDIDEGPQLNEGTCLIKGVNQHAIYLVTGAPNLFIRKHHIVSYETLLDYGFDESKIHILPDIVVNSIPEGKPIISGSDRASREGNK
jgi:hypothetical protein